MLFLERQVVEEGFYHILAVVKGTFYGNVVNVVVQDGGHLECLDR